MSNPATSNDLVARSLRTLTTQELQVGATLLDDAWNVIVSRIPTVDTRATPDSEFASLVKQVECAMVLRVLNNPNGYLSENIDDYEYRRDQAVSTGALYLSDAEYGLLTAGDVSSDSAFTIKPAGWRRDGHWVTPDWWVVDP